MYFAAVNFWPMPDILKLVLIALYRTAGVWAIQKNKKNMLSTKFRVFPKLPFEMCFFVYSLSFIGSWTFP